MSYPLTTVENREALSQGRFLGLSCQDCQAVTFPPQGTCAKCQSRRLEVLEIDPAATLRTFTVIRVGPEGRKTPYLVAMAELSQGPWVMGNLVGIDPESVGLDLIGRKVKLGTQPAPGDEYAEDTWSLTFTLQD